MTVFDATDAEPAGWQRRTAAELARILDAHRDLPLITWTVGAVGSVLVGQVSSPMGTRARISFNAWRQALALVDHHEHASNAVTHLSAKDHRDGIRIMLLADLLNDPGERP